jgi:hypothetical protein
MLITRPGGADAACIILLSMHEKFRGWQNKMSYDLRVPTFGACASRAIDQGLCASRDHCNGLISEPRGKALSAVPVRLCF